MEGRFFMRLLTPKNKNIIRKLFKFYFEEEVTLKSLQLSEVEKDVIIKTYMKLTTIFQSVVPQNLSVGVFDVKSDEICGCAFGSIGDSNPDMHSYDTDKLTPSLAKLLRFEEYMLKDLPRIVNQRPYLHIDDVLVKTKYQRQGLAMHLVQKLEEIALENKCELLTCVANTYKSNGVAKKHGFQIHNEVLYSKYKDTVSGEVIFKDIPAPYTGAAFGSKVLSPQESCL
uniref:Uncharacterized protein LOC100178989 n=1 Tax=Phallusia mammillata TaxID=59560 RepID=A0A6F9DH57_9ASCI|nr:uncharacterized protein LOC100178989 [Phallusia mammillata]